MDGMTLMVLVGVATGSRWVRWPAPAPVAARARVARAAGDAELPGPGDLVAAIPAGSLLLADRPRARPLASCWPPRPGGVPRPPARREAQP